jgi:hypothetical protein
MRFALALLFIAPFATAEESAYRWIQKLGGSLADNVVGIGADSQGNTYVAGTTNSLDFPVKAAIQSQRGAAPLYRGSATGDPVAKLYSPGTYVNSVAISQCGANTVFAVAEKELLQSTNAGDSWSRYPLPFRGNIQLATACVGGSDIVYAVAGKLYQTTDLRVWDTVSVGNARSVSRLWVDPNDARTLYATTADLGFARSRDGGDTWKVTGATLLNLSFVTGEPGVLYGPLFTSVNIAPAKSTDFGETWTVLTPLPGSDNRPNAVIRDPKRPNVLYAFGSYVSEDSGQSWTFRDTGVSNVEIDYATGTMFGIRTDNRSVVATTDGFVTKTSVIMNGPNIGTLAVWNDVLFSTTGPASNMFAAKYSPAGELLYSTYFGGSAYDTASAMAVDKDGSVYVTGTTQSLDFPTTSNAYIKSTSNFSRYLFKLDSSGQLVFSTIIATPGDSSITNTIAIAPDGGILLAGTSNCCLTTTTGAYQPNFLSTVPPSKFFFPSNAFVQRFRADGSALEFGTFLGTNFATGTGMSQGPDGSIYVSGSTGIFRLNADGSALLSRVNFATSAVSASIAVDSAGTVYTFQQNALGRWTTDLQQTAQGSLQGTNLPHLTLDRDGKPVLSGSAGLDFSTVAPLQGPFASSTGFVAAFNPDLSPSIATYAGNDQSFVVSGVVGLSDGGLVLTGSTLSSSGGEDVYVAALDFRIPPVRLDAIRNAASFVANPVAAREALVLTGGPFAADATVTATFEGTPITAPLTILARSASSITLQLGADVPAGTMLWSVQSGGQRSNTVKMPISPASPGIYTKDRSGKGQAVVFNKDGVPNDPDHPAVEGDPITIYATGSRLDLLPALYVGGFYANGIEAKLEPAEGFTGLVYKLKVFMPLATQIALSNPDVKTFTLPPTLPLRLVLGGVPSQTDAIISVKAK